MVVVVLGGTVVLVMVVLVLVVLVVLVVVVLSSDFWAWSSELLRSLSFSTACFGFTVVQNWVMDSLLTDARNARISGTPGGGVTTAVTFGAVVVVVGAVVVVVGAVVVVVGAVVVVVPDTWFKYAVHKPKMAPACIWESLRLGRVTLLLDVPENRP